MDLIHLKLIEVNNSEKKKKERKKERRMNKALLANKIEDKNRAKN